MPSALKRLAKPLSAALPPGLLRALRRRYYLNIVNNYREADWEWSAFIRPLVPSGSLIIDIGANVGYLSGLFARWVGREGRVISVEPIPATHDTLSYSMRKLFPKTVTPVQACMSDREGEVTMSVPEYAEGGTNYYESRIVEADNNHEPNQFRVPSTTLDLLVCDLDPTFIKIDVEGHELAVVKGGSEYLSTKHPPLLIEVAGNPDGTGSPAAELFTLLASWGYRPHLIKDGQLLPRRPGDDSVDYLFIFE